MKKREPVSKIMSDQLISVNITQKLKEVDAEVDAIIEENNIRHVPVVSGDKVIGLISKTDLERVSFVNTIDGSNLWTSMYDVLSIEQVMSKNLKTVQENDTIHDVAEILAKNEFHALPVLEGDKLKGIVTSTDLIQYLIDQY